MISFLKGTVLSPDVVFVGEAHGIGYRVATPEPLVVGDDVELHIVHVIREQSQDLFGFGTPQEVDLFRALTRASGVGASIAMSLMSALGAGPLVQALLSGDTAALARARGVGPTLAKKLPTIVNVKSLATAFPDALQPAPVVAVELVEALTNLGYGAADAAARAAAARATLPGVTDESRLLRIALTTTDVAAAAS